MSQFSKTKYVVVQREQIGKEKHQRGNAGGLLEFYVYHSKTYLMMGTFDKSQIKILLGDSGHPDWDNVMALFTKSTRDSGTDEYEGTFITFTKLKEFLTRPEVEAGAFTHLFNITNS